MSFSKPQTSKSPKTLHFEFNHQKKKKKNQTKAKKKKSQIKPQLAFSILRRSSEQKKNHKFSKQFSVFLKDYIYIYIKLGVREFLGFERLRRTRRERKRLWSRYLFDALYRGTSIYLSFFFPLAYQ